MLDAALEMLPMIIGAAIVPGWAVLMLIVLDRPDGVRAGSFLLGGILLARLLQGILFTWIYSSLSPGNARNIDVLVSLSKLIIGVLLLVSAVRVMVRVPDHDEPPDKILGRARTVTPLALAGVGIFLVLVGTRQWIFAIGALGVITASGVGDLGHILLYATYMVAASLPLIVPLGIARFGGDAGRRNLNLTADWLHNHEPVLVMSVSALLGAFFLIQGVRELT